MPQGPYELPLGKFVSCLDGLVKDKEYTLNEVSELCRSDLRTVRSYVNELHEINNRMPPPKRVIPKQVCRYHDGLVVDPPEDVQDWMGLAIILGFVATPLAIGALNLLMNSDAPSDQIPSIKQNGCHSCNRVGSHYCSFRELWVQA